MLTYDINPHYPYAAFKQEFLRAIFDKFRKGFDICNRYAQTYDDMEASVRMFSDLPPTRALEEEGNVSLRRPLERSGRRYRRRYYQTQIQPPAFPPPATIHSQLVNINRRNMHYLQQEQEIVDRDASSARNRDIR